MSTGIRWHRGDFPHRAMGGIGRAIGSSALTLAVMTGVLAGCSQDESPAETAPALAAALTQVDQAVEAERYGRARSATEFLLAETRRLQQEGDLSADDADRIRAAARALLATLPAERGPEESPSESEAPSDEAEEDQDEDKPGKGEDKPEKGGHGKGADKD